MNINSKKEVKIAAHPRKTFNLQLNQIFQRIQAKDTARSKPHVSQKTKKLHSSRANQENKSPLMAMLPLSQAKKGVHFGADKSSVCKPQPPKDFLINGQHLGV